MKSEISRFLISGAVASISCYLLYVGLLWLDIHYLLSMTGGYFIGFVMNFYLGRKWVFRQGKKIPSISKELLATSMITVIGLIINLAIITILKSPPFYINLYFSGFTAIMIVTVWNYVARKYWVYQ